ncbi:MAG: ATP-binding cassette domain-containing protein [Burkholderiaceae bacterium]|nr:ATP-binding cassette domain-containing protein [Burkholderiaceae bacterium]
MIELKDLRYDYRNGPTLSFANLSAPAGSTLLVRGASGAGKSTLLALMAGLLTPTAGRVVVDAVDVGALPPRQRDAWRGAHLGFVPQRLHLSAALSVADNLALPYICAGEPVQAVRIAELLERLGLQGLAARKPYQLSVGQAQRVALARAVLRAPSLLLADEPTASLDDEAAAEVLRLLAELAALSRATLVLATHDARVSQALPDAQMLQLNKIPT